MPCRYGFRLCLSNLIYTVWPCLIHTCHAVPVPCRAVPRPCRSESDFSRPWHSAAWVWHGICEFATAVQGRHVGDLPLCSACSGYHAELHESCYQKHTNPLNFRTSSSDTPGYHADFHEGHGTVGEWQVSGRVMAG
jgi:hypothetical protein